ncbi:DUF336-domain-containing protein [Aureobasidium subglaciale]|uniref:DUF336-domain-containing protein n=1 Tax=Aureobasidium subglaciale (strain EXF-2481) TaxID=1043005 RepID=A0A074YFL1_AURSE|nr:uncharacterized protein AUEXF2481DRAFT_28473 [Aureobasidium subglaciale EXF-2481]KAI5194746.1 DUF336-domain-containing protein [Aureobasidium subglaciale]KAI5213895.1 DUF336-domain-containing protein [Aureobasidium subglaciale]KAI5216176.1 DUF336-domain-containing protein [Aureobasidium subglaciale]KAI5239475.1 DUF336-domain-containing protein [Aureobasidium subglaciale]KAI5254111.1 DUF336-domain-containing protein [Aureobasidium subglaciale]
MSGNLTSTNNIGSTPSQRHYISADQATAIVAAAAQAAASIVPQNIAVVDPSGLLVAFVRMDNAYPGSIDISMKKARTSVLFNGIPSAALYNQSLPGEALYGIQETNGGLVIFGGGLPLLKDNYLLGAIGVSGGTVAQDIEVAQAGVDWLTNS